jgi:hypothetical protein
VTTPTWRGATIPVESRFIPGLARTRTGFRLVTLERPSVRALVARRQRCAHCHRTPLVGERVFFYGERMVCALCRHLRREPPGREDTVHAGTAVKARRAA